MRNAEINYCTETGKYCYSSEAKATRAMTRYSEIKRVYFCNHCEMWHTTKLSKKLAIERGIVKKDKQVKEPHRKVKRRLKTLLKQELEKQTTLITKTE